MSDDEANRRTSRRALTVMFVEARLMVLAWMLVPIALVSWIISYVAGWGFLDTFEWPAGIYLFFWLLVTFHTILSYPKTGGPK